jgi:hypothetical protein
MRRRKPGGGAQGKWPTMVDKRLFVLYDYKTSPTVDVLGTPLAMVRSKAHKNLQKLARRLYAPLAH